MLLYIIISSIIIFCLVCVLFFILKKYKRLENDAVKISLAAKRARYGDINVRVGDLYIKELEASVNRLLETIYDRELMIKEYQNVLSKKNLTLEEIIKQEKQLRLFKEEFAATLTHDMKVPVIAELNSLNFLLEGRFGDINEKQSEILKLMKASNQELKDLIENMLEIYKLDNKELELNLTNNNFNDFLLVSINEMKPIIFKTNHEIIFHIDNTKNMNLVFDSFQLKRVVKNLIQNAITFSYPSSQIKIETYKDEENIKVAFTNEGNTISDEDLELIFNKYYSGHSKFRKSGTGLGLYLARQIILAHNGNLSADCSQKNLTSFILTLPIS